MANVKHKKAKDQIADAHEAAEKDISRDPEFGDGSPADDLDEGELARKDNSGEEAFDSLERPARGARPEKDQSGTGSEK